MDNFATGGIVFNNDPTGWNSPTFDHYYSYAGRNTVTLNVTYADADVNALKHFITGIIDGDEPLTPTEHPLVAIGDDIILINLTNGDEVQGQLEDILTGKDVEYVYVINERRYFEPEWTILE